jgi:hypothetical protein
MAQMEDLLRIKRSRTMRVGLHQMDLTGQMAPHLKIKGDPMITRLRRQIAIETEVEIVMVIVTAIMTVTAAASHITTCTLRPELL